MIPRSLLLLFVASAALAAELEDSEQKVRKKNQKHYFTLQVLK